MEKHPPSAESERPQAKLRIYFLPNLMTAGNLFCGFVALTKIVEAKIGADGKMDASAFLEIKLALAFILLACIFDLLDGRLARMGGVESDFGREFDSLADLISFGAARPSWFTGWCCGMFLNTRRRSAGLSPPSI